ncbi:RICIN domain-containing protein [Streptomyces sp. NPDC017086]|uniref:RICIN domain-containing protein n=1 Tax=Streptomyces sp. NPDC017086 TaxID=3364976 RepID=UPI0037BCB552
MRLSSRAGGAVAAAVTLLLGGATASPAHTASTADARYTVTVSTPVPFTHPTDTPATPFLDRDGTFHYQQSAALYGAGDPRVWDFYTGADFDTAVFDRSLSEAADPANPADRNDDTTWRCDNSPTGREATYAPSGSHYTQRNYCDLSGVWVDPDTGDWYGLVHNEFTPQPFGDGLHYDAIDYAVSTDRGRTWTIEDHVLTSPYSTGRGDTTAFPHQTYSYGDGDQRLFVDTASGYFYVYYGSRIVDKDGGWKAFHAHVARAPIAAKMAPGSWRKWYGGSWSQPGTGGRESTLVPADASHPAGYPPVSAEYDPARPGTAAEQIAAGDMPPTSPLFLLNIAYDAHLGRYIGTPQAVDQSGGAPQYLYATDDLATQKWRLIGDTGDYTTASWYRWFLDPVSRTGSSVVGRTFRAYCSFGCSHGSSGEYADLTVDSAAPAAPPVDPGRRYRIAGGTGRVLAQESGGFAVTSVAPSAGSARAVWSFAPTGDGAYTVVNAATGRLLGVDSTRPAGRAWGARPTATAARSGEPAAGQQWFVLPAPADGTHRLVNRYSGLVLGLSATAGRRAETTPARTWTAAAGTLGDGRGPAEQTLSFLPAGA